MDAAITDRLADANVLVLAGVLQDRFIEGRVTPISGKAPVPVLKYGSARAMMAAGYSEISGAFVKADGGAVEFLPLLDGFSTEDSGQGARR